MYKSQPYEISITRGCCHSYPLCLHSKHMHSTPSTAREPVPVHLSVNTPEGHHIHAAKKKSAKKICYHITKLTHATPGNNRRSTSAQQRQLSNNNSNNTTSDSAANTAPASQAPHERSATAPLWPHRITGITKYHMTHRGAASPRISLGLSQDMPK